MQEIGEITELYVDNSKSQIHKDDIEVGLEIVALEMGHVLEQLKDNLEIPGKEDFTNKENSKLKPKNSVISDKFQNKPTRIPEKKNKLSNNSILIDRGKFYHNLSNEKYHGQKMNSRPNYHVQKTNYHKKCDTLMKLPNNLCPKFSTSKNISCDYIENKINATQENSSKIFGRRIEAPALPRYKSSAISTNSVALKRKPLYDSRLYLIKTQLSFKPSAAIDDPLKPFRDQVDCAIRERKTFTVCGNYYTIRRALLSRGWIEKIRISFNTYDKENLKKLQSTSIPQLLHGINDAQNGYIYKRMIMSKMLGTHQVDFYWDQYFDCFRVCHDNVKLTLINRFRRGIFSYTSKQGLCESMKQAHWFQQPGVACVHHPRSYNLSNVEDPKDFINDFKLTAAMSLLKWVVKQQENICSDKITAEAGKIPIKAFHFAVSELHKAVRKCKHEDIDYEIEEAMDHEWNEFLEGYYKIVHIGSCFKSDPKQSCYKLLQSAQDTLKKIEKFWPHLKMDGMMNVWILKPTNGSRGEGIYLCRTLQYILKTIKCNVTRRYIVQKYIERPLLIFNTKFDIRQWFLISSAFPLTIWIYQDCYVRFSSQLYNLRKLHESIHLTNNSVQCRYKNCNRNASLPPCNMWDCKQFQKYLTSMGHPNVYMDIIYPGMKECITGAIVMNQSNLDNRRNCFELYGSDFMLTEDFKPWLIEINSRPALYASTPVTARMCPQVLDDLIKVIIDYPKNPKAPTGRFELLYKENTHKCPQVDTEQLKLNGQKLPTNYFYTPEDAPEQETDSSKSPRGCARYNIKQISSEMKATLENLLSLIQVERERRKQLKHKASQASDMNECNTTVGNGQDQHAANALQRAATDKQADDRNKMILEVIKSVASNLRANESTISDLVTSKSESEGESFKSTEAFSFAKDEIKDELKKPRVAKSDNPKGIFRDIIDSIRSLTFLYRSNRLT